MAYRVQGVVRIDNSGNINSGILTATSINSTGVATATEFDGKVSSKAITEQTEGAESDVTGADEILIYDVDTTDLLRVTVDEFIGGSGIGTIVTDFSELNVTGIVTAANVIVSAGGSVTTEYVKTVSFESTGVSTVGFLTATDVWVGGAITATSLVGNGSGLTNLPAPSQLNDIGDVSVANAGIGSALVWNGSDWVATKATNISPAGALVINYRFSNNTTMADPGDGFLRVNNANQYQATAMAIDVLNWGFFGFGGSNMSLLLLEAKRGTRILLQASQNPTQVTQYVVNEDPVLVGGSTGYVSFPSVTSLVSTQQNIPNNTNCMIAIQFPNQATNVTISPDHVNTPSIVVSGIATLNTIDAGVSTSYVSISTSLVPSVNDAVSLGSSERKWKDLWVSGDTVFNNLTASGVITATEFQGDGSELTNIVADSGQVEVLYADVRNTSGSTINAGTPVYITGYNVGTDRYEIAPADASNSSTMPAAGILKTTLVDSSNGEIGVYGQVTSLDTSDYSDGDELWVAVGAGLTSVRPTGASELVQKIGQVLRSQASTGVILVEGAGRTNDVPNSVTSQLTETESTTDNATRYVTFVPNNSTGVGQTVFTNADLKYNPSTGNLTVGGIDAAGIITASSFSTGNEAISFDVVGSDLIFTVAGIGSVTLALG